jgi:hypothetical protein
VDFKVGWKDLPSNCQGIRNTERGFSKLVCIFDTKFQARQSNDEQFVVDIGMRTYSYRKWDILGIPCMHDVAALAKLGENLECYSIEAYKRAYGPIVYLTNGPNNWPAFSDQNT